MKAKPLSLRESLTPCVDLRFPDFEKHYANGLTAKAYYFDSIDCLKWHQNFLERVFNAQKNKQFLPIYRINHGEFVLAIGYRYEKPWYRRGFKQTISALLYSFLSPYRSGSRGYGFEKYSIFDLNTAREKFLFSLKEVAKTGILAIAFHDTVSNKMYTNDFCDWMSEKNISLSKSNYFHFYSVYALMHGSDRFRLIGGKAVLVVTSLTPEKKQSIMDGLNALGASNVQFLEVSREKAILDVLDLSQIHQPIDLVLVAAGTGSASLMLQLSSLNTVCIDVGFCLDTIADPSLRWNRTFCIPDDEFDISRFTWIPKNHEV